MSLTFEWACSSWALGLHGGEGLSLPAPNSQCRARQKYLKQKIGGVSFLSRVVPGFGTATGSWAQVRGSRGCGSSVPACAEGCPTSAGSLRFLSCPHPRLPPLSWTEARAAEVGKLSFPSFQKYNVMSVMQKCTSRV